MMNNTLFAADAEPSPRSGWQQAGEKGTTVESKLNVRKRSADEIALAYMPLGRKVAWSYAGRGAEYEDLVQEAFLALRELAARHENGDHPEQSLGLYIWFRLRGKVRDAAARLRSAALHDSLEQRREDDGFDVPFEESSYAVFDLLEGLSPDEQRLARGLARGVTQKEFAREFSISQQGVSKRIGRLREKLRSSMCS